MSQALARSDIYTEDDYYNLPENVRAELIDGQFYDMAAPSRIHQKILNTVNNTIFNYIHSKGGSCEVYPAPFAVKLFDDRKTVVDPRNRKVLVYHLEQDDVKADSYTFQDKIKVNIYDDLWISLQELGIPGT